jgi:hypothetical protein
MFLEMYLQAFVIDGIGHVQVAPGWDCDDTNSPKVVHLATLA